jgi:vacuolar-type H+-ATPase subunit H
MFDEGQFPEQGGVDILYLLDRLEEMVGVSKRVPFSHRVMVEEDEFLDLVEQLRIAIPNEVKQAQRVVRDRERVISEAQLEATRIVETARTRAEYLVSQQGILNEARQRSEELLRQAEERKKREMGQIDVYAMEQFNRIEQSLREGLEIIDNAVQETVTELQKARNAIGQ